MMGGNRNHWLSVRLVGWNRRGGGVGKQWGMVRSGSSYCSQSDLSR
jgi:hypothetical protein